MWRVCFALFCQSPLGDVQCGERTVSMRYRTHTVRGEISDTDDGTSEDRTWGFQNDTGPNATLYPTEPRARSTADSSELFHRIGIY